MLYQTINPYTEELVKTFPQHTDTEIESIIAKAEETYATDWSQRSLAARKAVLKKAVSILREKIDEFAQTCHAGDGQVVPRGKVGGRT